MYDLTSWNKFFWRADPIGKRGKEFFSFKVFILLPSGLKQICKVTSGFGGGWSA